VQILATEQGLVDLPNLTPNPQKPAYLRCQSPVNLNGNGKLRPSLLHFEMKVDTRTKEVDKEKSAIGLNVETVTKPS
jgi:hypothetical protein